MKTVGSGENERRYTTKDHACSVSCNEAAANTLAIKTHERWRTPAQALSSPNTVPTTLATQKHPRGRERRTWVLAAFRLTSPPFVSAVHHPRLRLNLSLEPLRVPAG